MRHRYFLLYLAGAWMLVSIQMAFAAPGQFLVNKYAFFNQTSSAQPGSAAQWNFAATIYSGKSTDATNAQLTPPGRSPIAMTGSVGVLQLSPTAAKIFSSQSQLDGAFPDGTYVFKITSGNLSGGTASVTMPDDTFYPATVPYLDAPSFAALENFDPSQPLRLTWNSFTPDARTTSPYVGFSILDNTFPYSTVFYSSASTDVSSFTSATIPVSTLTPNHSYSAYLSFSNEIVTPNAFLGSYDAATEKQYYTVIRFTTTAVPEPSTLALLGFGAAGLCLLARCRRTSRDIDRS